MRLPRFALAAAGLALAVIVLDQLTKAGVVGMAGGDIAVLPDGHRFAEVVPGLLRFTLVRNDGVSFGLFGGGWARWVLSAFPFVVAGVMSWWALKADRPLMMFAAGLLIGGAFGNVIDRFRLGYVIDFVDFSQTGAFPWVFNVADVAVNLGVALLLLDGLRAERAVRRPG
jgi:signal peptidase II